MDITKLTAGDTLNYTVTVNNYSPADGWALKYSLVPRDASAAIISITSTSSGSAHLVQVGPSTTSLWTPGEYGWTSYVERAGERYSVARGQLQILIDPTVAAAGTDTRSQAEQALAAAKAALAAWTPTTRRYKINGREMEFSSTAEIIGVISYWQGEVKREQNTAALASGLKSRRQVHVRLGRA